MIYKVHYNVNHSMTLYYLLPNEDTTTRSKARETKTFFNHQCASKCINLYLRKHLIVLNYYNYKIHLICRK